MEKRLTCTFLGTTCVVRFARYRDTGHVAIRLEDPEGMPFATATVNAPDVFLEGDEVLIKNWSENEGILDALVRAGIVKVTPMRVTVGRAVAPVCKLTGLARARLAKA